MRRESPINVDRRHEEEFPLWFRNRDDVMPAGGKRLRCDSSVRAESSPGTLAVSGPSLRDRNELPSPDTASPVGTQSSCASTSGIRHVRGSTRGIALLKARTGGKLTVHIPDGHYDRAEDRFTVTSTMNTAYRTHRNRMFQHYSVFNSKEEALEHPYPDMNKEEWTRVCDLFASEEFQRRSAINKENRAKLKIVHTSGARSFQRTRALLKNPESDEISAALLYKKTHTNKDGMWTSEDAQENFLEEARLQIEEMRARQLEYEALLVKRSDMEQTMREHLQMMEEQQRKKDEELMQMMAEQQRKKDKEHRKMMEEQQRTLVEQQERRMQLMAEQMREQLVEQIRQLQSRSTPKRKFGRSCALSHLLNNPQTLKKAQEELDPQVDRERHEVKESDLKNLVYLQAVVKETMRLYPSAPLLIPHESGEDCTIAGYHVPAGTRLFVNVSKIHRDPNVWSDPNEFRPERFLTTSQKNVDFGGQSFEYLPFGSGRRVCPRISLALHVMHLTLANLLHAFEITTPFDEPVDMAVGLGPTNLKATPLEVHLSPRLPAGVFASLG
ncbi:Cytochrome P450 82C4 [Morella rubra]|uniref:Cytochrome P450 82C4 n=1 Tax=Morella rubra TaxID=262757 RepID=A0A6A1W5L9_9ROSI|nr:Cytochrome P450 82C4 [Morella rubra]